LIDSSDFTAPSSRDWALAASREILERYRSVMGF